MSLLGPCLFRACDILVAQPDAWDRYGERATLCSSSFARVDKAAQPSRRAAPGAALAAKSCEWGERKVLKLLRKAR